MNQVEFLGLVHTFATVPPGNVQNILHETHVVREVLRNNYQSRHLIGLYHFLGVYKPKKFHFVHQTVSHRREGGGGGGGHETEYLQHEWGQATCILQPELPLAALSKNAT